jgi:hypothetical protein
MAQCGFDAQPAALTRWYREQGWPLPGLSDAKAIEPYSLQFDGKPRAWPEGITVFVLVHKDGYQLRFPGLMFDDNGARKKMVPQTFELEQLLRWKYRGVTYAYRYYIWPLSYACDAVVDLIDDRGDGKFRLLLSSPGESFMAPNPVPPPVPAWLTKPNS